MNHIACKILLIYRYLATGNSFKSLTYLFRVSEQTISECAFETTTIIWSALENIVMDAPTEDDWLKVAADFEVMWDLPHCIGAIDGKHVRVRVSTFC